METQKKNIPIGKQMQQSFLEAFCAVQRLASKTAHEKGWWDKGCDDRAQLLLMHAELSEAAESMRLGEPNDDHLPTMKSLEVELADVIIRIMTYADKRQLRVAEAVLAKVEFNMGRPRMHGNKLF